MNDDLSPPIAIEPTPAPRPTPPPMESVVQQFERAEAAATRRRWLSLAELVGIVGLLIAGLSLWFSWSERRADDQEKQIEKAAETKVRTLVLLTASPLHDGEQLVLKDATHQIQSIDIRFPTALGLAAQRSVLDPHIEAGWLSDALLTATDKGPDKQQGRVPVMITASYWDGDEQRSDDAIYDLVWTTKGHFIGGRSFRLKGALLRERSDSIARLNAIWDSEKPKPAD